MSKIKPNKLAECQKQAGGFNIEQVHRPTLKRYDTRATIIKLNQTDYITKIQGKSTKGSKSNTMALLGYTDVFVLHDPTIKAPVKKKAPAKKPVEPKED